MRLKRDGQSPACRNRDVQRPGFCVIVNSLTWFGENTVGRFRVFVQTRLAKPGVVKSRFVNLLTLDYLVCGKSVLN